MEKRQQILEAAAEVFAERGFQRARFDDVARRVGMDRASLYYYVGSKSDLFEAVAIAPTEANVIAIEVISRSGAAPEEKLAAAIERLMESYEVHYPNLFVYIREHGRQIGLGQKRDRRIAEIHKRYDSAFVEILEEGRRAGVFTFDLPANVLGYSIVGMVAWSHTWFRPGGGLTGAEIGRGLAKLVLHGLRNGAGVRRHPA
ncbi:MAG: TetR/AcrR family transcriptional regulator [Acidimicrobiia bacterium]